MPWSTSREATSSASPAITPTATTRTSALARALEHVDVAKALDRRDLGRDRSRRVAQDRRGVRDQHGLAELLAQGLCISRRCEAKTGHDLQNRQVPHAVVGRSVRTGDACAVEHERHAGPVQRTVQEHLVERPVEERGVDRHHRVQPCERHAGSRGRGVLLRDPDVEDAARERLREGREPHRRKHGRSDCDHVGPLAPDAEHLLAEHRGPGRLRLGHGLARHRVDDPDPVELVHLVLLRGLVAQAPCA